MGRFVRDICGTMRSNAYVREATSAASRLFVCALGGVRVGGFDSLMDSVTCPSDYSISFFRALGFLFFF